jgi:alpha-2-macroglobulin
LTFRPANVCMRRWRRRPSGTRLGIARTSSDRSLDTALLATVAAGVGDPVADSLFAYVEANPPTTDLAVLETVGFVRRRLPRLAAAPAVVAWTLDGQRHVVELRAGDTDTIALSAAQRSAVSLEVVSGAPVVTATWQVPLEVGTPTAPGAAALERRVSPAGDIAPGTIVDVVLSPTLRSSAAECWEITDTVPSGLAPVEGGADDGSELREGDIGPDAIVGQRVVFSQCTPGARPLLVYRARVVTAGEFRWEPALVQRMSDRAIVAIVPATRVRITPP